MKDVVINGTSMLALKKELESVSQYRPSWATIMDLADYALIKGQPEARAALAAPEQSHDAWVKEAERLLDEYEVCTEEESGSFMAKRNLLAHLRNHPAARESYKLLKDTTHDERDWPEDAIPS